MVSKFEDLHRVPIFKVEHRVQEIEDEHTVSTIEVEHKISKRNRNTVSKFEEQTHVYMF